MMKAGTYYVGDLCYVMHNEWREVCEFICSDTHPTDGEFTLKSGVRFACYGTMYGDGSYECSYGKDLGVDSGTIGCILVDDIDLTNKNNSVRDGVVIEFKHDFHTYSEDGTLTFGDYKVWTNGDDFQEEDEDY